MADVAEDDNHDHQRDKSTAEYDHSKVVRGTVQCSAEEKSSHENVSGEVGYNEDDKQILGDSGASKCQYDIFPCLANKQCTVSEKTKSHDEQREEETKGRDDASFAYWSKQCDSLRCENGELDCQQQTVGDQCLFEQQPGCVPTATFGCKGGGGGVDGTGNIAAGTESSTAK